MRIRLVWTLTALLSLLAAGMTSCSTHAQTVAPAAEWNFDEGVGALAADTSGGHSGTMQGDAGWGKGLVGPHALLLPGQGHGFLDASGPVVDTSKSFTVMAWAKVDEIKGYQTVASIDGGQISGFFLQLRADTGRFAFTVPGSDSSGAATAVATAKSDPVAGVWYHLAGAYDAAAQTITLYVNGQSQATVPFTTPWQASGHTAVGRGFFAGGPVDFVGGSIDDVRFYGSALSPAGILAIARPFIQAPPPPQPASLQIQLDQPGIRVSPLLYGLMTEEINHSYDGGLYAELIQNRAFKDDPNNPVHWSLVQDGGGSGAMTLDTSQPVSDAQSTSLKLSVTTAGAGQRVGIANDGYWGVPVRPSTHYRASFYARSADGFQGPLAVTIESTDGATIYARSQVPQVTGDWRQYTVPLVTRAVAPTEAARFVITADHPGTIWLSLVSLFPPTFNNRPNGNRTDLMQKMSALRPAFIRLPGGNYLEGDTIAQRFDWKKTVGPLAQRPGHRGPWGYRSTDGMGLLEFLEWCEDLHAEPVLAVFAGYALNHEHVVAGPELTPFVQDAMDEIEYATGGVGTRWGAERARDGHPAPFPLHYVEVGNEDFFDNSGSYGGRYAQFYDAIKAKYPQLQVIATTGVKSRVPDVIDEHYYRSPRDFESDAHHYDGYNRQGPKIFVGEWASQEGKPTPDMNSALGDAAWMTGMERNADVVVLESYAPLLVNVNPGGSQWGTNLIGYDALSSYGSPSYYAQVMFDSAHGDVVVPATLTGGKSTAYSVTRDSRTGTMYVKMVNWQGTPQPIHIILNGVARVAATGTATTLASANTRDTNTLSEPTKIVPVTSKVSGLGKSFNYSLAPYSITVLQFQAK